MHSNLRHFLTKAARQLGCGLIYAALVWVVLAHITPTGTTSGFFPASGFALAVLLIGGKRYAWGVLGGALAANFMFGYSPGTSMLKSVGSTLAALSGRWLLTRSGKFDRTLPTLNDYLRLLLLGGAAASLVSAAIGTASLVSEGIIGRSDFATGITTWWRGDTLGVMLLTPICLLLMQRRQDPMERGWIETGLIAAATFLAGQAVYQGWFAALFPEAPRGYWMFLFIFIAAVRLNPSRTALILLMVAIQAIAGALRGIGTYADDQAGSQLFNYWFHIVILSLVGMTLSIYLAQRRRAENALHRLTDELGLYNRVLQQINHGDSMPHVLDELARGVEALHPGIYCSILLLDKAPRKLRHGAAPSLPHFYNQAIDGLTIGEGASPCGTAAHRGTRVIVEDIREDALWPPELRALAHSTGVRSCWSQPVKDGQQQVIATLAIYHTEPAQPSKADLAMMDEVAGLAARVIEQTRIQNDLRLKNAALDASADATFIVDRRGVIEWANPAFGDLCGYALSEVVGRTVADILQFESYDLDFYRSIQTSVQAGNIWFGELRARAKDGAAYDLDLKATPTRDEQGDITHAIGVMRNITERKTTEQQIHALAFYDTLTGLANRRLLYDRLEQALVAGKRSGNHSALMFLDLDHFKALNDRHGHEVGDLLLIEVARRLANCVRATDSVARFGGDEFVVLLQDLATTRDQAVARATEVAEKIRLALAERYRLQIHGEGGADSLVEHRCTASIGFTLFVGPDGDSAENILKRADRAMYDAKHTGRNQISFRAGSLPGAFKTAGPQQK